MRVSGDPIGEEVIKEKVRRVMNTMVAELPQRGLTFIGFFYSLPLSIPRNRGIFF
jgi:phosphoribosylamine-glycine ligase